MKSIIIYYSYGGNTRTIAKAIHEQKGYDMVEIKPVIPYTNDYQKLVDEEENKMHQEEMESLKIEPLKSNYPFLVSLEDISIFYNSKKIIGPISFDILPMDRIWLKGSNG